MATSEFQEMSNQKALLIEEVFGMGNGLFGMENWRDRRRAAEFLVDLHRGAPETYTADYIVGVWGGNVDRLHGERT